MISLSVILFIVTFVLSATTGTTFKMKQVKRSLILISLDGFHPDYLGYGLTPTLVSLADRGIRAEFMQTTYPSITFPNHYSIVTGLHAESVWTVLTKHGIVGNTFYDPITKRNFTYTSPSDNRDPHWWKSGEPIYTTAETQGLTAASMMAFITVNLVARLPMRVARSYSNTPSNLYARYLDSSKDANDC